MRIGIDVGGTKIEGIAIDDDGRERLRRRIPAPRGDYAQTLAAVVALVYELEREIGARPADVRSYRPFQNASASSSSSARSQPSTIVNCPRIAPSAEARLSSFFGPKHRAKLVTS